MDSATTKKQAQNGDSQQKLPAQEQHQQQFLVWQKPGTEVDPRAMALMAGDDIVLDQHFFCADICASRAHVEGLQRIGVLQEGEVRALCSELDLLAEDFRAGKFVLDARFEDGHSAIEARLSERLGDVGRKVHTGRSRNDQVLVATRLWLKEKLSELEALCVEIAEVCLEKASSAEIGGMPMPGYTHLQRAVVSSVGQWHSGWAESFTDSALRARHTRELVDANPLGTAAGYGVNLPLDRDFVTERLGFARLQVSPQAVQLSRGKYEITALEAFGSAMLDVRRLAWDLSLFTTAEFQFVQMPASYTTGSSIMPNKRNPDVVELLRGSYARVSAARTEIEQVLSLPSGYQRDLQLTKGPLVRGCTASLQALALVPDLLRSLQWNGAAMRRAIEPAMYATDVAIEQARAGVPFRVAYQAAAKMALGGEGSSSEEGLKKRSPEQSLRERVSPGAAGQPLLERLRERLRAIRSAATTKN